MAADLRKRLSIAISAAITWGCLSDSGTSKTKEPSVALTIKNAGPGRWGRGITKKIRFEENLSLGKETGEDHFLFREDISLTFDDRLDIYVLDCGNHRLMKFDKEGEFQWTAGRRGQGPGEFLRPTKVIVDSRKQTVDVLDADFAVHVFDKRGHYQRTFKLRDPIEDIQRVDADRIFARVAIPGQLGLAGAFCSDEYRIMKQFPISYSYGPIIHGGGDIGGDIRCIGGKIFLVLPDRYGIREYDLEGNRLREITRDLKFDPPEVKIVGGGFSIGARTRLGPVFVDAKGFIINQVFELRGTDETNFQLSFFLDFFDPEGHFLGSFPLPDWTKLLAIDQRNNFYFLRLLPFPSIIRSSMRIH